MKHQQFPATVLFIILVNSHISIKILLFRFFFKEQIVLKCRNKLICIHRLKHAAVETHHLCISDLIQIQCSCMYDCISHSFFINTWQRDLCSYFFLV